ncbi:subtilisin-like protease [Phyllosticta capitalensis]|uniref:peptidase S8/S53 domain-containing protein n=1 Tax=Phyllosticta capitalensis TaxID=121624 RepID=UPI00312EC3BF
MKSATFLALAAALGAQAAPQRRDTSNYDVILDSTADVASVLGQLGLTTDDESVSATYTNSYFKGFSGAFTADQIKALDNVTEVSTVNTAVDLKIKATRSSAPWGLQRISQTNEITSTAQVSQAAYTYTYSDTSLGSGVDIYIVDTGIRTTHEQFGSRAKMGFTAFSSNTDDNGHGTHVSGTSAGKSVGIASNANLIGVKVLDSSGSGTSSGLISGLDYVASQHDSRSDDSNFVASVASMSLGFSGRSTSVESALKSLSSAGVHIAVAAGNDADNACSYTPSALGGSNSNIISVGASNINDEVAYFSNTGSCVDIYAPGLTTYSSYDTSDTGYAIASGTSMATPHISGLLAYFLAADSSLRSSPATLKSYLKSAALSGKLSAGSANVISGGSLILANNGETGSSSAAAEVQSTEVDAVVDLGVFY